MPKPRQVNPAVKYAKLAPPRVFDALARPRLFAQLDALRQRHPVIWIASPPGAGKTTLAVSYLAHAGARTVWCQIDAGDADAASFFFYLAETVRASSPPLPWLAPELAGDVPRFARMFFRAYYASLPQGTVVVFDNVQELDWQHAGAWLEVAFSEVPEGITLLVLSRDAPPARLARLELEGRIARLGWEEVRLDGDEARALAQLDQGAVPDSRAWLELIDGWAAGAVMLRGHVGRSRNGGAVPQLDGRETVFRYFAGEILGHLPPASQRLLLLLSSLPGVTAADAQQLPGDPSAPRLLGRLFHERLFVDRRGPAPHTYHFHALFREFLQHEAAQRLAPDERATLLERAAGILDAHGRTDDAARLLHEAQAWTPLTHLLLRQARTMLATGRGQSWREWMGWLPPAVVAAEPWLSYWQGSSLNHVAPLQGRLVLVEATQAFHAAGQARARLLAMAAIVDSYLYEWADFHGLPQWIQALQDGLHPLGPEALDAEAELKIHSRLTMALFLTDPGAAELPLSAQRAFKALGQVDDPAEQLAAGTFLLDYFSTMDLATARQLFATLQPLADNPAIGPFHRIWWCRPASFQHQLEGNHTAARAMIQHGKQLATDFGLTHLQCHFNARIVVERLAARDLASVAALLDEYRQNLAPSRTHDLVYLRMLETCHLAQQGEIQAALRTVEDAERLSREAAVGPRIRGQIYAGLACCCLQAGDFASALRWSDKAIANVYGVDRAYALNVRRFVQAYAAHSVGDTARATGLLQELFHTLRGGEGTLSIVLTCFPQLACVLLDLTLREGIEVDYVRALIARQGLPAPDRWTPHWPWPVAVRSLGKIEMSLHGRPLASTGKAQQRPLLLLKALVLAGDTGKPPQALAVQLWPESDDPKAALNVTVHRLRKMLGDDGAIQVAGGRIRLNEASVWTDVAALGEVCNRAENLPEDAGADPVRRLCEDLLALYLGPFCEGDEDPWLLPARNRWQNRFLATAGRLGQRLEGAGDWTAAQELYARAVDVEPLAETLHRGLMRSAQAQGDVAAATGAYQRCRALLTRMAGRKPSPETERLAGALQLQPGPTPAP